MENKLLEEYDLVIRGGKGIWRSFKEDEKHDNFTRKDTSLDIIKILYDEVLKVEEMSLMKFVLLVEEKIRDKYNLRF